MLTSRSVYNSILLLEQLVKISKIVGFDIVLEHVHRRGLSYIQRQFIPESWTNSTKTSVVKCFPFVTGNSKAIIHIISRSEIWSF